MHPIQSTQVSLEPLKVAVRQSLGSYVAESMVLSSVDPHPLLVDQIAYQLTAKVLASQTARDNHVYEVKHPASWWQHLKHSHAPAWLKTRYPVRYETTKVEANFKRYATYPKADFVLPPARFGYPVTVEMADTSITSPWGYERVATPGRQQPVWVSSQELVYRLAKGSLVSPHAIVAVLDGLAGLGVNTDELVRDV